MNSKSKKTTCRCSTCKKGEEPPSLLGTYICRCSECGRSHSACASGRSHNYMCIESIGAINGKIVEFKAIDRHPR